MSLRDGIAIEERVETLMEREEHDSKRCFVSRPADAGFHTTTIYNHLESAYTRENGWL